VLVWGQQVGNSAGEVVMVPEAGGLAAADWVAALGRGGLGGGGGGGDSTRGGGGGGEASTTGGGGGGDLYRQSRCFQVSHPIDMVHLVG
jgi:hypothetical protein